MNKPLTLNRNAFNRIVFASDFHYNHNRDFLWGKRNFLGIHEHDRFIENECSKLTSNDLLIYLGDFSLNSTPENTMNLFKKINCNLFYVFGNHESQPSKIYNTAFYSYQKTIGVDFHDSKLFPFSVNKTTLEGKPGPFYSSNEITFFGEECYLSIGNTFLFCRHMAPLIWDKMKHHNFVAICGHSHGNCSALNVGTTDYNKILDVGVENAMSYNGSVFFSLEEIISIMEKKNINIPDHHGDEHV